MDLKYHLIARRGGGALILCTLSHSLPVAESILSEGKDMHIRHY